MIFFRDFSISAVIAEFVTVLVSYTSAGVIVFQAAQALGASQAEIASWTSWMWALGWGMGLTSLLLSLRYKQPVVTAWSTPGAALLITAAPGASMPEAIGAFIIFAVLMIISGFTGWFERAMDLMPRSLTSAMLAGILLQFGLNT